MAYPPPPYKDAVAGNFVAGEALVGTWWAYSPVSGLGLLGIPPTVSTVSSSEVPQAKLTLVGTPPALVLSISPAPPQAGLGLAAPAPALRIDSIAVVAQTSLVLEATAPGLRIDSLADPAPALLSLLAYPFSLTIFQILDIPSIDLLLTTELPIRVGQPWLWPTLERTLALDPTACVLSDALTPTVCEELLLVPTEELVG